VVEERDVLLLLHRFSCVHRFATPGLEFHRFFPEQSRRHTRSNLSFALSRAFRHRLSAHNRRENLDRATPTNYGVREREGNRTKMTKPIYHEGVLNAMQIAVVPATPDSNKPLIAVYNLPDLRASGRVRLKSALVTFDVALERDGRQTRNK
jgi:hypothetical protein